MKELISLRTKAKAKKPSFNMQDAHKFKRLAKKWRKPRGSDSKMRQNLKGYAKSVSSGYGSPKEVRGLDRSGLEPIVVASIKDLEPIKKDTQGVVFSSTIGNKKKVELLKKAQELGLTLLNMKDASAFTKNIEEQMKQRKKDHLIKLKRKVQEKKKEKKDDKLADKVISEEEKAKADKKEKDKILTTKE